MTSNSRAATLGLAIIALFWLGMLLGVSFLATPVKFLAPSLSLPVALDVGRQTFAVFNAVEVLLAVLLLLAASLGLRLWPGRHNNGPLIISLVLLALVLVQTFWLLPVLDARVEIILQGETPPQSFLHWAYIGVDLVKVALLVGAGWIGLRLVVGQAGWGS